MPRTRLTIFALSLAILIILVGSGLSVAADPPDTRVNCHASSPIVIFCEGGDIVIYMAGEGGEILRVTAAEQVAAELPPEGEVTLVKSLGDSLAVYLLSNGQYMVAYVNTDRDPDELFTVFWGGCSGGGTAAGTGDIKVYNYHTLEMISDADGCGQDGTESEPVPVVPEEPTCGPRDCNEGFGCEVGTCSYVDGGCYCIGGREPNGEDVFF